MKNNKVYKCKNNRVKEIFKNKTSKPTSLLIVSNILYICDTENNRIL